MGCRWTPVDPISDKVGAIVNPKCFAQTIPDDVPFRVRPLLNANDNDSHVMNVIPLLMARAAPLCGLSGNPVTMHQRHSNLKMIGGMVVTGDRANRTRDGHCLSMCAYAQFSPDVLEWARTVDLSMF